jgi:hypothetical protein
MNFRKWGDLIKDKDLGVVFAYAGLFVVTFIVCHFFGFVNKWPASNNMAFCDAGFYSMIAGSGYEYYWYKASTTAFFPLFPYLWRLLHVDLIGISIINFLLFATGSILLIKKLKVDRTLALCILSFPASFFFFVPFSESLFFLCTALLLVGIHLNNWKLIAGSLFFASMVRSASVLFVPAILCMEILSSQHLWNKALLKRIAGYSFVSILGMFVVVLIQFYQTNEWFAVLKQQRRYWRHHFFWPPQLPFISCGGNMILWLDGLAFFVGVLALVLCAALAFRFFRKKEDGRLFDRPFLFSAGYLVAVLFYSVLFNRAGGNPYGTDLSSMGRYVFATAFFFVFAASLLAHSKWSWRNGLCLFLIMLACWFMLGLGRSLTFLRDRYDSPNKTTIFFAILSLYVLIYFVLSETKLRTRFGPYLICLNMFLTAYLFNQYLNFNWVG